MSAELTVTWAEAPAVAKLTLIHAESEADTSQDRGAKRNGEATLGSQDQNVTVAGRWIALIEVCAQRFMGLDPSVSAWIRVLRRTRRDAPRKDPRGPFPSLGYLLDGRDARCQAHQSDRFVAITERIIAPVGFGKGNRLPIGPVAKIGSAPQDLAETGHGSSKTGIRIGRTHCRSDRHLHELANVLAGFLVPQAQECQLSVLSRPCFIRGRVPQGGVQHCRRAGWRNFVDRRHRMTGADLAGVNLVVAEVLALERAGLVGRSGGTRRSSQG